MNNTKPVNGLKEVQYVSPLLFEAQNFAMTLRKYGQEFNLIDHNLCAAFEEVIIGIERFLNKDPKPICETANTKIAEIPKDFNFDLIYCCKFCQEEFKNPKTAAQHLSKHLQKNIQITRDNIRDNIKSKLAAVNSQQNAQIPVIPPMAGNNQVLRPSKAQKRKERRKGQIIVLPKKIKSLFQRDLREFILSSIATGDKLKKLPEYDKIVADLNIILKPWFPNSIIKIYFFGSRVYGLGQPYSDLDIFIDIGGKFNNFENKPTSETLNNFRVVANALKKSKVFHLLEKVEKARVPVLKVNHKEYNIDCDLSFSNGFGYTKTALVKYLLELQPTVKYMCIVLKRWNEISRLHGFSSYSLILLIIGFSQLRQMLPTIECLQRVLIESTPICPWITVFAEKTLVELNLPKIEPTVLLCKKLIKEFFQFYARFNFKENLICPYYGKIVEKKQIHSIMPGRYSDYCRKLGGDSYLNLSHMTIQDPIQLNHNLTKGLSAKSVELFQEYCRLSAELLNDT